MQINYLKTKFIILNAIIPGWGFAYLGKLKTGLAFQALFYFLLTGYSLTRTITDHIGFLSFMCLALSINIIALISSIFCSPTKKGKSILHLALFPCVFILINISIFINKSSIIGIDIHKITSESMEPTLFEGDYVVSDTWAYKNSKPQEGDIILFTPTANKPIFFVKRVHPFPSYLTHKPESFYLLGDNPSNSIDSRYLGPIDISKIHGKYQFVIFSTSHKRK